MNRTTCEDKYFIAVSTTFIHTEFNVMNAVLQIQFVEFDISTHGKKLSSCLDATAQETCRLLGVMRQICKIPAQNYLGECKFACTSSCQLLFSCYVLQYLFKYCSLFCATSYFNQSSPTFCGYGAKSYNVCVLCLHLLLFLSLTELPFSCRFLSDIQRECLPKGFQDVLKSTASLHI